MPELPGPRRGAVVGAAKGIRMQWEIKQVFVPFDVEKSRGLFSTVYTPRWKDSANEVWKTAQSWADEGWELVGTSPINEGHHVNIAGGAAGFAISKGVILFFKRSKP